MTHTSTQGLTENKTNSTQQINLAPVTTTTGAFLSTLTLISSEHKEEEQEASLRLQVPNTDVFLCPGDFVKLGRFDDVLWEVDHGWFSFGGNRPWCGWYLKSNVNGDYVEKPIQLTDLDDVYVVKKSPRKDCQCR